MKRQVFKQTTGIVASLILFCAVFLPLVKPLRIQAQTPEPIQYVEAQYNYVSDAAKLTISNPTTADFTDFTGTVRLTAQEGIEAVGSGPNIIIWKVGENGDGAAGIDVSGATDLIFWIRTAKNLSLNIRMVVPEADGYSSINKEIAVEGAEGWQQIKMKIADFSENAAVLANMGYVTIAVKNCADLVTDDTIDFGRLYFFDQDPGDYSTLISVEETPEPIQHVEAAYNYVSDAAKLTISNPTIADFTDFTGTVRLTAQEGIEAVGSGPNIIIWKVGENGDSSAGIDVSGATDLMFWIRTAKNLNLNIRMVVPEADGYSSINKEIAVEGAEGWQRIKMKIADFTENAAVLANMGYVTIAVKNCADLVTDDTIDFGRLYFFDQDPGDYTTLIGSEEPETPGNFIAEYPANYGTWHVLGDAGLVTISENAPDHIDAFEKALNIKISGSGYYNEPSGSVRFCTYHVSKVDNQPLDMSAAASTGYLYLWVRSKTDVSFVMQAWNTSNWSAASSPTVRLTGSPDWQLVGVKLSDMSSGNTWSWGEVHTFEISPVIVDGKADASTFLAVGDSMDVGSFMYYDGPVDVDALIKEHVTPVEDSGEDELQRIFLSAPYQPYGNSAVDDVSTINAALYDVADNKNFIKGATVNLLSDAYYTAADKKVNIIDLGKDGAVDISKAIEDGVLRFWVQSSQSMKFRITMFGYDGNSVYKSYIKSPDISISGSTKWQEIRVPLSEFTGSVAEYSTNKLCTIMVEPGSTATAENGEYLNEGESFNLGQFEIWNMPLDTEVDPEGGTTEPAKTYPPAWEDLPAAEEGEESRRVQLSNISSFWINEWNAHPEGERVFNMSLNAWDKTDDMYSQFTHYRTFSLSEEEPFYSLSYNEQRCILYFSDEDFDLSPYIRDGYMRFWIKVPKTMNLTFGLQNDGTISYATPTVTLTLEPTEENNGFAEVWIPLKDFYDDAVEGKMKWDPSTIGCILVAPEAGKTATAESFLAVGEELSLSLIEIWTKEPLEPQPYDPTRFFYCGSGNGIMLRDINEVMPLSTVINAMHNTYEWDGFADMLNRSYSKGAKLLDIMTIRTMSDTQYDRRYTEPYDTVELMIPLTEALQTDGMKVAVITADGEFTALEARVEGEYLVVPTIDMGDFVFYTADGEFNWNYKPDEVGPDANKPGGDKDDGSVNTGETITGVLWSVTCLSLSALVLYVTVIKGRKERRKAV